MLEKRVLDRLEFDEMHRRPHPVPPLPPHLAGDRKRMVRPRIVIAVPSGPTQTVERITPVLLLPYMILSPQAPYSAMTFLSGSDRSVKGSLYLLANFLWEISSSGEMPITTAFCFSIFFDNMRNPCASLVQPGVSSLG